MTRNEFIEFIKTRHGDNEMFENEIRWWIDKRNIGPDELDELCDIFRMNYGGHFKFPSAESLEKLWNKYGPAEEEKSFKHEGSVKRYNDDLSMSRNEWKAYPTEKITRTCKRIGDSICRHERIKPKEMEFYAVYSELDSEITAMHDAKWNESKIQAKAQYIRDRIESGQQHLSVYEEIGRVLSSDEIRKISGSCITKLGKHIHDET